MGTTHKPMTTPERAHHELLSTLDQLGCILTQKGKQRQIPPDKQTEFIVAWDTVIGKYGALISQEALMQSVLGYHQNNLIARLRSQNGWEIRTLRKRIAQHKNYSVWTS